MQEKYVQSKFPERHSTLLGCSLGATCDMAKRKAFERHETVDKKTAQRNSMQWHVMQHTLAQKKHTTCDRTEKHSRAKLKSAQINFKGSGCFGRDGILASSKPFPSPKP